MLQFLVDSVAPDGLVLGRNGDFDIPIGTTFSNIRLSRARKSGDKYHSDDLGCMALISLTLREILWYRKSIEFVPAGHTAGLRVDGDGLSELTARLRNLPSGDYISLTASQSNIAEPSDAPKSPVGRKLQA